MTKLQSFFKDSKVPVSEWSTVFGDNEIRDEFIEEFESDLQDYDDDRDLEEPLDS